MPEFAIEHFSDDTTALTLDGNDVVHVTPKTDGRCTVSIISHASGEGEIVGFREVVYGTEHHEQTDEHIAACAECYRREVN